MTVSSRGSAERRQAMVEYLKQMSSIVMETEDKEEASVALSAIIIEIKGKESLISTDQKLSKVLEKLVVTNATTDVVRSIWNQLNSAVLDIIYDQYGSHVLETLIKSLPAIEIDSDIMSVVNKFAESMCSDICNLIADIRGTHVVRTAVMILGGVSFPQTEETQDIVTYLRSDKCTINRNEKFSATFGNIIESISTLSLSDIDQLAGAPHSSMTLQTILLVAEKNSCATSMIKSVLFTTSINVEYIECCLDDKIKSKFIEVVVESALVDTTEEKNIGRSFIDRFFFNNETDNRSCDIFSHRYSFGFVQSVIAKINDPKIFGKLVVEYFTTDCIVDCVKKGRGNGIGVIQRVAEKLVTFVENQKVFFERLLMALGIEDGKFVWSRLLSLGVNHFGEHDIIWDESISQVTAAGALLVSTVMGGFKQSAVQMLISNAASLMDNLGSIDFTTSIWMKEIFAGRCLQTLVSTNSALPTGTRKKIIRQVLLASDHLDKIVLDRRVGSWLVTSAWDSCAGDVDLKKQIGEKLIAIDGLRENCWKVWRHCGLATFSRRNTEWTEGEKRKAKAQNVFADIIGDHKTFKKSKN